MVLTQRERLLLERLASEGKATRLLPEDVEVATGLEEAGLVFLTRDATSAQKAIITPRGRRLLAEFAPPKKPGKRPLGFLS